MIFTEFSPLTPESDSITLSRMFCEKFQSTPIRFRTNWPFISSISSGLLRRRLRGAGAGHSDSGFKVTKNSEL